MLLIPFLGVNTIYRDDCNQQYIINGTTVRILTFTTLLQRTVALNCGLLDRASEKHSELTEAEHSNGRHGHVLLQPVWIRPGATAGIRPAAPALGGAACDAQQVRLRTARATPLAAPVCACVHVYAPGVWQPPCGDVAQCCGVQGDDACCRAFPLCQRREHRQQPQPVQPA